MYFEICRTYFFFAPNPAENRLPCGFRKATHNAAFFVRIRNVPAPPVRSVHVSCKIKLRSESFKPQWFLLQNMLTLQQPVSRQRCRAASGYGYIYKRRLLDALYNRRIETSQLSITVGNKATVDAHGYVIHINSML